MHLVMRCEAGTGPIRPQIWLTFGANTAEIGEQSVKKRELARFGAVIMVRRDLGNLKANRHAQSGRSDLWVSR